MRTDLKDPSNFEEIKRLLESRMSILSLIGSDASRDLLLLCRQTLAASKNEDGALNDNADKIKGLDEAAQSLIADHLVKLQDKIIKQAKHSENLLKEIEEYREETNNKIEKQYNDIIRLHDIKKASLDKLQSDVVNKDRERVASMKEDLKKHIDKVWEEWEAEKKLINKLRGEIEKNHKIMEQNLVQTLRYFSITDDIFKTGGFQTAANNEARQANVFRIISISLMIAVSALVGYTILSPDNGLTSDFLYRFILIFTLLMPAGYAAREAGRHRTNSEMYRLAGIEMSTLDTFLGDMDPANKEKIKELLVDRYFGHFRFVGQKPQATNIDDFLAVLEKVIRKKVNTKSDQS